MKKRYLVLADGTVFEGRAFGADCEAVGEVIFNTGVCGYVEELTDPAYYGQIIVQTFPLNGNYGIMEEDFEGKCHIRGYVVREWCNTPSNFRSQYDVDAFLKKQGVPGLCGVDTRAITKKIREDGVTNGLLCDEVPADLSALKAYKIENAIKNATCAEKTVWAAEGEEKYRVTLIDCGMRKHYVSLLQAQGCAVTVVPADTAADDILAGNPDGVMISGGPGDPAENAALIGTVKALMGKIPMFGMELGHQLMALAAGASLVKLTYGHHGGNQPVRRVSDNNHYITAQNHNYVVDAASVKSGVVSYVNANDGTCEGIDYPDMKAFSVQFSPDTYFAPRDKETLFGRFINMMEENKHAAE